MPIGRRLGPILPKFADFRAWGPEVGRLLDDALRRLSSTTIGLPQAHASSHLGGDDTIIGTADPEPVGTTADPGSDSGPAAAQDHAHRLGIVAAKGDILTHNGTDPAAQTVGANDTVLMADSTQGRGLLWATVASVLAKLLTAKGDLAGHNGTTGVRVAAGADGTAVVYEASQSAGVRAGASWKGARTKALTNGVATGLFKVALPDGAFAGGSLRYLVVCTDGADYQAEAGIVPWAGWNDAGVYGALVGTPAVAAPAPTAGTLTVAFAASGAANELTIDCTATSSLSPTTLEARFWLEDAATGAVTFL